MLHDSIIAICFILVTLVSPLKQTALRCLFVYLITLLPIHFITHPPYQYYLVVLFVYIFGTIAVSNYHIRRTYLLIISFMYLMVIDAMLNPEVETILWNAYPWICSMFNMFVMWLLVKGNYNDFCLRRNFNSSWLAHFINQQIRRS